MKGEEERTHPAPSLREDGERIVRRAIEAMLPDEAVRRALHGVSFEGRVFLVAAGKAAWRMANAARACLGTVAGGVVITKYGHLGGRIEGVCCYEAGHPVPDENSLRATDAALALTSGLRADDTVIFLLSGGGSALFERPLIPLAQLQTITDELLARGADIAEINTVRKRLSAVKGGRFGAHCAPARVFSIILSDVLGDREDLVASGPACADPTTCAQAVAIAEKYRLTISPQARALLEAETPKALPNVTSVMTGSVRALCAQAARECAALGYEPRILTDALDCEASQAGRFLAAVARTHRTEGKNLAFLAGGETVVHLRGRGKGGRCQELALAAACAMEGVSNVLLCAAGSDGTDGPTDAAGGIVDGATAEAIRQKGIDPVHALAENDSYHALAAADALVITGPTGTNVNDIALLLVRGAEN